jgi:hypothetical protein
MLGFAPVRTIRARVWFEPPWYRRLPGRGGFDFIAGA